MEIIAKGTNYKSVIGKHDFFLFQFDVGGFFLKFGELSSFSKTSLFQK